MGRHKVKVNYFDSLLVKMNSSHVKAELDYYYFVCFNQQYQKGQSLLTMSYPMSKIWHTSFKGSHCIILVITMKINNSLL